MRVALVGADVSLFEIRAAETTYFYMEVSRLLSGTRDDPSPHVFEWRGLIRQDAHGRPTVVWLGPRSNVEGMQVLGAVTHAGSTRLVVLYGGDDYRVFALPTPSDKRSEFRDNNRTSN